MVDSSHPEVVPNSDVRPMEEEYVSKGHLKSFGSSLSLSLSLSLSMRNAILIIFIRAKLQYSHTTSN
jgi:hypothetical protein